MIANQFCYTCTVESKAEKLVWTILSLLMLSEETSMESTCWEISFFVLSHFKKVPLGIDQIPGVSLVG